jgi:hypothetical protein
VDCNVSLYRPIVDDESVLDSVSSPGVFHPLLTACKRGIFAAVDLQYRSPDTFLDLRVYPAITVHLVFVVVLFAVGCGCGFLLWRSWARRKRIQISMGILIVLDFLNHLFRYIDLQVQSKSDGSAALGVFRGIFQACSYTWFAHFFVLSASGLSVISEEAGRGIVYESLLMSFVLFLSLANFFDWDLFPVFVQALMTIVGLLLYGRTLLTKMHEANEKITVMIVNTETRAVQTERKFRLVLRVLLSGGLFLAGYVLLLAVADLDQWLQELLFAFGEVALIGGFLFVYAGEEKRPNGPSRTESDLLTIDIDDVPGPEPKTAIPLLDLVPE